MRLEDPKEVGRLARAGLEELPLWVDHPIVGTGQSNDQEEKVPRPHQLSMSS